MRWIDIELPPTGSDQEFDSRIAQATRLIDEIPAIQARDGLDNVAVVKKMQSVGQQLFRAVTAVQPHAFNPENTRHGSEIPGVGIPEYDRQVGYHLITAPEHVGLPWIWLYSGIDFLLAKSPICASQNGSRIPDIETPRSWMERFSNVVQAMPDKNLRETLARLQPNPDARPEILFIPGHCDEQVRSLMYREAEGIQDALSQSQMNRPLASLTLPDKSTTPQSLVAEGLMYQAIHFAGPTSQPLDIAASNSAGWIDNLLAEPLEKPSPDVDQMVGLEPELVGIDPITALLDSVLENFETSRETCHQLSTTTSTGARVETQSPGHPSAPGSYWLLEDGPLRPEALSKGHGVPPLVFSNSYCSLPEMGDRFLTAGVSAFVGPVAPLFSRPARSFARHFYNFMSDGLCAAAALQASALACRDRFNPDHPAWLSYGVVGYGSLALQYL